MPKFPYQHLTRLASLVGVVSLVAAGANALPAATASAQASEPPTTEPNSGLNLQSIGFQENISNTLDRRMIIGQATPTGTAPAERNPLGLGVSAKIGTLGIGLDVTKSLLPQVDARLGINFGSINVNQNNSGINYDAKLNFSSIQLLGDYYPFGGSFRLTGGLVSNNNKFSLVGTPSGGGGGTYTIDNTTYNASDVGSLTGEIKSGNSIAPYLGIGFGKPTNEGLAFNTDLGIMFAGSPKVTLNASNPNFNNNPTNRAQLDNQARQTENDAKGFNLYPVLSIGLSYGF